MNDLRIALLGKKVEENEKVENILKTPVNDEGHTERVRGNLEERKITVISSHHLLCSYFTEQRDVRQKVKQFLFRFAPGPHVILLVLQHDFSEDDKNRVKDVLKHFSEEAIQHTLVVTTDEETHRNKQNTEMKNNHLHQLIKECGGGHLQFDKETQGLHSEIIQRIEMIIKKNRHEFLICEQYEGATKGTSMDKKLSRSGSTFTAEKNKKDFYQKQAEHKENNEKRNNIGIRKIIAEPKLNLVLCGRDGSLKASVSKLLRDKIKKKIKLPIPYQKQSKVCVKKEGKAYGRQITVVELPALSSTDLSEEKVIHETLSCVSLCGPGVHAFLFICPVGPCTDKDKAEMEKIKQIFDLREHIILIFSIETIDKPVTDFVKSDTVSQVLISLCDGQYRMMGLKEHGSSRQIPDLLLYIENSITEPYSLHMYVRAQEQRVRHEVEKTHKKHLMKMEKPIKELQQKIPLESIEDASDSLKSLRIVLIGKTGNGKSATGNTILGRNEFHSEANAGSVTNVCQKKVGEVDGKSVAVIDTPGLFDTTLTNEEVQEEISRCISLSAPGPHAFIIVLNIGRFTKEEMDTLDLIKKIFGPKAAQFSIVLFTRGDELEDETLEDFVNRSNSPELNKLLSNSGNRFLAFNNRHRNNRTQVTQLLNMIEMMIKSNTEQYFTNSMFEEAEMSIKKRVEEILKEKEREIQALREELKLKHEMEMEGLKKRLEEEKRKIDEEREQMKNMFFEMEEKFRKEFEKEETEKNSKEEQQTAENQQTQEEWKREKKEDDVSKEEVNIQEKRTEALVQVLQTEIRRLETEETVRKEKEERDRDEMKKAHERKMTKLMKNHEDEARKQAEVLNIFKTVNEKHIHEINKKLQEF